MTGDYIYASGIIFVCGSIGVFFFSNLARQYYSLVGSGSLDDDSFERKRVSSAMASV
jgi:hypothetical protein